MATTSQRQEQFRQGRLAAGYRREAFWLEPAALSALERLRSIHTGLTRDQLVGVSLIALLEHNKPLDDNSVKPLLEDNGLLCSNSPVSALLTIRSRVVPGRSERSRSKADSACGSNQKHSRLEPEAKRASR